MVGVAWELSIIIGWPITGGGVARGPQLTNPGQVVGKQHLPPTHVPYSTARPSIRYDTRCYFNVRSKANMRQLNLPHGTDN